MSITLIVDKSTLQSLSVEESVWMDALFYCGVPEILHMEILADIAKRWKNERSAETEVKRLAEKLPEMRGVCIRPYVTLAKEDLLGQTVPMTRKLPAEGFHGKDLDGEMVAVMEKIPGETAWRRWQQGEFTKQERDDAEEFRRIRSEFRWDIEENKRLLDNAGINVSEIRDAGGAWIVAGKSIDAPGETVQAAALECMIALAELNDEEKRKVKKRWELCAYIPARQLAPYAAYVAQIFLAWGAAAAADLPMVRQRSAVSDMPYLLFLPFVEVFSSNDKLHIEWANVIKKQNQTIITGTDMKAALQEVAEFYERYAELVEEYGALGLIDYPPEECTWFAGLWDKMRPEWRRQGQLSSAYMKRSAQNQMNMQIKLKKIQEGLPEMDPRQASKRDPRAMAIKRHVPSHKGRIPLMPAFTGKGTKV